MDKWSRKMHIKRFWKAMENHFQCSVCTLYLCNFQVHQALSNSPASTLFVVKCWERTLWIFCFVNRSGFHTETCGRHGTTGQLKKIQEQCPNCVVICVCCSLYKEHGSHIRRSRWSSDAAVGTQTQRQRATFETTSWRERTVERGVGKVHASFAGEVHSGIDSHEFC